MKVTFLKDLESGSVDAVIISETTESQIIEKTIATVKEQKAGFYEWDNIIAALPKDCLIFDKWQNPTIYY